MGEHSVHTESLWDGRGVGGADGSMTLEGNDKIRVTSNGKDLWTEADSFFWVTRRDVGGVDSKRFLPEIVSFTCCVEEAGTDGVHFFLKAGIVVRESETPGARTVALCATSKRAHDRTPTVVFLWRSCTQGAMDYLAADFVMPNGAWPTAEARDTGMAQRGFRCEAPVHLRLDRDMNSFTAYVSASGLEEEWVQIGSVQLDGFDQGAVGLGLTRGGYTAEGVDGTALFSSIQGF